MAEEEKLPWELIEEILSRVPPTYLVRFRVVSKQCNTLLNDKNFIHNHKATFRFILATKSKIYSVSIDPKIEVHDQLTLDVPGLESQKPNNLIDCNEFLLCGMDNGAVICNPWLKQTRWIECGVNKPYLEFCGIGYDYYNDGRLEGSGYKTLASYDPNDDSKTCWIVNDLALDEWKEVADLDESTNSEGEKQKVPRLANSNSVALNKILYWVAYHDQADPLYHLLSFEFFSENFVKFCDLPCGKNHRCDALVLNVFRGDRFSLLKQCLETKKIEIWVTKKKINYENGGDDVVWMNFMTLTVPNFPCLAPTVYSQPSYFIDDKRLVVCSCDENGQAWIYVARDNKLISNIKIDSVVDPWPLHCTYFPSLVSVPSSKKEEA